MSQRAAPRTIWLPRVTQTPEGERRYCAWCDKLLGGRRRTFCSADCEREVRIRAHPSSAGHYVWERDGGICAICGLDAEGLDLYFKHLSYMVQTRYENWTRLSDSEHAEARAEHEALKSALRDCEFDAGQRCWHADHIVPVADGGGACGLDNYRTLCTPCHKAVTREWHAARRKIRMARHTSQPVIDELLEEV